ncbi:MAG TPA: hypothetical protein VFH43_14680 [Candidatus Kapabacteria bacterium]|nr:hypothetical protein [Candidatus Kapabacteria bacterium]
MALFSNRIYSSIRTAFLLVLFVLSANEAANAQVVTSVRSGNWSDRAVWSDGAVPRDGSVVVIENGDSIRLNLNSARLKSLEIRDGVLFGGRDTLYIDAAFTGTGIFSPDSGTVVYFSEDTTRIDGLSIGTYHNLTLADSNHAFGPRTIDKDLTVTARFEADFRKNDSASISGIGSIKVGGDLIYIGASASEWSGRVTLDRSSIDTAFLIVTPTRDTNFAFPQITIAKRDTTQLVRVGRNSRFYYPQYGDTLYLSSRSVLDTSIILKGGTLDLVRGHIRAVDTLPSPQVYIGKDTRYRTGARGELDTMFMSRFILDTNSTFEFYCDSVKDITYSIQQFSQPHFWHLWLGAPTLTGIGTQDLEIKGKLLIQNGAEINPRAGIARQKNTRIIIHDDVINESRGESGSIGAGTGGGDGMSPLNEHWVFDSSGDTIHWSGPAEMQRVTVKEGTVLSVRFVDHEHCDSLLFIDSITEEGGNCGARIIGKIFTLPYRFFQLSEKTHDFGNIGLTVTTGEPYLQHTRVVRYAGYLPPGERLGIRPERTVLRYFNVIPGAGPQSIAPSTIKFDLHCDEINGVDLDQAIFWRSTSNGASWAHSGITSKDVAGLSFVRDTAAIGFPFGSNNFLWTLSTQRDDIATPVLLESFSLTRELNSVKLDWRTSSEINVRGFAIERTFAGRDERVASCESSPGLLARSYYGSEYTLSDEVMDDGLYEYELIEVSLDGLERSLAKRTIRIENIEGSQPVSVVPVRSGTKRGIQLLGRVLEGMQVEVFDAAGRRILSQNVPSSQNPVLDLDISGSAAQVVFVRIAGHGQEYRSKVLLPAF